jgi:hypothetical protein
LSQAASPEASHRRVPALKIQQWLQGWNKISFDPKEHRRRPRPYFFLFSLPARELRSLSGIARRSVQGAAPRAADLGIQRQHEPERSAEIKQFVEYGFPWSTLSESKRESAEYNDLRKPGWLPTAIVINILEPSDRRPTGPVGEDDLVKVEEEDAACRILLPYLEWTPSWRPSGTPPFEVIDGQHRLWAFENADTDFELPVVAPWSRHKLAGLFILTINIKPKRINPSLAFDLYPLLRAEDWLDRAEGHEIYRDTRSQELAEALWSHAESPWHNRINMLGEKGNRWVTQAAWIKSLTNTFIRRWTVKTSGPGGLFGSRMAEGEEVLGWSRAQQAAFLIYAWQRFRQAVADMDDGWARKLRIQALKDQEQQPKEDAAFYGRYSLIASDQGVRGFLHVLNDICFIWATRLQLRSWQVERRAGASDIDAVTLALATLR